MLLTLKILIIILLITVILKALLGIGCFKFKLHETQTDF